ncbi:hypothetical protein BCR37DRAFT_395766 [Protomyces lactucae-debilis]|uniref:Uncharacterized protein n=1 Tax=Protomyces lactucae-debilis TaxID=2754530 RepID=A0A1Y2ESU1_PROLT|nr:uncharacterized protein BCR37DRAFT_395766 [Protomyces lactucae-debilis]ORY74612.1 hypothetical protein BCR37DRAFT_395766 [Protomyces lactucae-debilis]
MSKRGVHLQSANREAAIQDTTVRHWKKRWLTPQPIQPDPPTTTTHPHTGGGYGQQAIEQVTVKPLAFKVFRWISVDDLPAAAQFERAVRAVDETRNSDTQQVVEEESEDLSGVHREDVWLEDVSSVNVLRRHLEAESPNVPTIAEPILLDAQEMIEHAPSDVQQQEAVVDADAEMVDASAAIADNTLVPVTQPAPADEQGPSAIAAPDQTPVQVDVAAGSELAEPVAAAAQVAAGLAPVADPIKPADMDAVDASIPAATPVDGSASVHAA